MKPDRIAYFEEYLQKKPDDDFAQYALAMEYGKVERHDDALRTYRALTTRNPDYSAAYHQCAILLQKLGRLEEAKAQLRGGIAAATRTQNAHARREMEGLLADLEESGE